jgi:hypothetical protein|tara:strand:- start:1510 stop:3123 length:1614 start_codon:yes stop_codon:yes gene_type:complete
MAIDQMVADLDRRYSKLLTKRSNWESLWQELGDYVLPRKAEITKKRIQGGKRTELIFDSTAVHAVELLASSLHGMLTNAAMSWFSMQYRDIELAKDDKANEWLAKCTRLLDKALKRSNFNQEIHELYFDLVVFGTGCLFIEYDEEGLRFSARHIGEITISANGKNKIDTVYRTFKMTARQIAQKFGKENLPDRVQKDLMKEPYNEHEVVHVVYPSSDAIQNVFKKPVASCYYHKDSKAVLQRGGFDEFPFCVPRFNLDSTSIYGRSPAMSCLADVKMVNKMSEVSIKSAQKQLDPPLLAPDDGFFAPIRTTPGALNFYRSGTRDRIEPLVAGTQTPIPLQMEEQRRNAIRAAFYVDQLQLQQGPQMTATEVLQRNEEKMRLLGPVMGRLQTELLQPLINRSFQLMLRNGQLPDAPPELQGRDIDIEYVSPLAKAQKTTDLQSVLRGLEAFIGLREIAPGVMDYIDDQGLVKYVVDVAGIPAEIIRSDSEVEEIREEQAEMQAMQLEQQQQMMAAEQAQKAAPMMKVLTESEATESAA